MCCNTPRIPKLVPCVYCGHRVSVSATACPKCKRVAPLGLPCMLCGKPIRSEDMFKTYLLVCHRQCLSHRFTIPASASCPDCGVPLTPPELCVVGDPDAAFRELACAACGRRGPLGGTEACSFCSLLVYNFQVRVEGRFRGYAPEEFDSRHVLHDFCVATGLATGSFDYDAQTPRGLRGKVGAWVLRAIERAKSERNRTAASWL